MEKLRSGYISTTVMFFASVTPNVIQICILMNDKNLNCAL